MFGRQSGGLRRTETYTRKALVTSVSTTHSGQQTITAGMESVSITTRPDGGSASTQAFKFSDALRDARQSGTPGQQQHGSGGGNDEVRQSIVITAAAAVADTVRSAMQRIVIDAAKLRNLIAMSDGLESGMAAPVFACACVDSVAHEWA